MHDLGYLHLRVVNEYPVPFEAAKSAVDASSVLAAAREFTNVAAAIADCHLVFGTTAVGERVLQHPLYELGEAAGRVADAVGAGQRVALLFGSEKTGLSNEELSYCHALLTIPMNTRGVNKHLSMNLGQAVAICLYAIAQKEPVGRMGEEPASSGDLDRLHGMLTEVLEVSGYTRRYPANARDSNVRRLVLRMGMTATDAPVWTGILRQLLFRLRGEK
jgi:tRNA/rRNA methyltransferase